MPKVVHIIGNGDSSSLYLKEKRAGIKLCCNQVPFEVPDKYATMMVDFKMMDALTRAKKGDPTGLTIPGDWILGFRPKKWMSDRPNFYMMVAHQVREFYTDLPRYTWDTSKGENMGHGYTNLSCGHFAAHYALNKMKADEVHLYGFDSVFDFNMNSYSDLVLESDRGLMNSQRLSGNWRPVWEGMFKEFPNQKFVFHYFHDAFKVKTQPNVSAVVYKKIDRKPPPVNFDTLGQES